MKKYRHNKTSRSTKSQAAPDPFQNIPSSMIPIPGFLGKTADMSGRDMVRLPFDEYCSQYKIFRGNTDSLASHLMLLLMCFLLNDDEFIPYPEVEASRTARISTWRTPEGHARMVKGLHEIYFRALTLAGSDCKFSMNPVVDLQFLETELNNFIPTLVQLST